MIFVYNFILAGIHKWFVRWQQITSIGVKIGLMLIIIFINETMENTHCFENCSL